VLPGMLRLPDFFARQSLAGSPFPGGARERGWCGSLARACVRSQC